MPAQPRARTTSATADTIELSPLSVRADVGTVNDEARTVDLIFSTGAAVERFDWWTGKRYIEKLSMDPAHIRLQRLNAGAPLLDAHSAYSITDQIGAVEQDSARVVKKEARATVRFSRREAVEPIWQDVCDGIIKSVSVGYRVHRFEETAGKDGAVPTRLATDWEPFEISLVPMPADAGARVRKKDEHGVTNSCVIVQRDRVDEVMDADRLRSFRLAQARS